VVDVKNGCTDLSMVHGGFGGLIGDPHVINLIDSRLQIFVFAFTIYYGIQGVIIC